MFTQFDEDVKDLGRGCNESFVLSKILHSIWFVGRSTDTRREQINRSITARYRMADSMLRY